MTWKPQDPRGWPDPQSAGLEGLMYLFGGLSEAKGDEALKFLLDSPFLADIRANVKNPNESISVKYDGGHTGFGTNNSRAQSIFEILLERPGKIEKSLLDYLKREGLATPERVRENSPVTEKRLGLYETLNVEIDRGGSFSFESTLPIDIYPFIKRDVNYCSKYRPDESRFKYKGHSGNVLTYSGIYPNRGEVVLACFIPKSSGRKIRFDKNRNIRFP